MKEYVDKPRNIWHGSYVRRPPRQINNGKRMTGSATSIEYSSSAALLQCWTASGSREQTEPWSDGATSGSLARLPSIAKQDRQTESVSLVSWVPTSPIGISGRRRLCVGIDKAFLGVPAV